jgi:hypothetical protein
MKKLIFVLSVCLLPVYTSLNAQSLKSILKHHFEAVGQENIIKAEALVINGKINQMGMELPFVIYQKRPGKVKFVATFQDMQLVQSFDGKNGWAINPMNSSDPIEMGISEKKTMESMADMDGRLYNWKKKKYKVSYEGDEDFEGVKMYKIKLIASEDDIETYYIHSGTYLISKVDSKNKVQGMDVEASKIYSDYRDINGYQVPFKTLTYMMGQEAGDLDIISFEMKKSSDLEDAMFLKPGSK